MTTKRRQPRAVEAWAGFSDGRIHATTEALTACMLYAVYTTHHEARECYDDVRRVRIVPIRPKRRSK